MTWELTPELADTITSLISKGKSLRAIGRMDDMPSRETIMRWEKDNPEFAANVARAREAKYEDDIEELEEINHKVMTGVLEPAAANVVSNNLKWVASRLLPKKYGDTLKHTGDADQPVHQKLSLEVSFVGNANRDTPSV